MCEKKRIKSWIVILVGLLVGLIIAFLLGFVLPGLIQQKANTNDNEALMRQAKKDIESTQENVKKATETKINNYVLKIDHNKP
jgi:uncharacterized membrane-anchored protein YhcB (DUF1043 family)